MRAIGSAVLLLFVALGAAAFVPPCVATADAFETPKTAAWCLALLLLSASGLARPIAQGRRDLGGWAGTALLAWMALRSLLVRPVLDPLVLVGWMLPVAFYLVGRALSRTTMQLVAYTVFGTGCVQVALMLLQRLGMDSLFGATTSGMAYAPGRMIGTVGYHNQAVDLLAVCAALGMGCCRNPSDSRKARNGIAILVPPAVLAGITALAAYRAGLAGTVAGIASMGVLRGGKGGQSRRIAGTAIALLAAILCAVCLAVPPMRSRLSETMRQPLETPALRTRATMARASWAMIRERPVAGWGSGAYAFQYMRRVADGMPEHPRHAELRRVVYAREPHNDFLHLWCEFGLVGLFLAGVWIALAAAGQPVAGRFLLGYWLIASCFGFPWHDTAAGPLAGLALGMLERRSGDEQSRPSSYLRLALLGVGGMGVAVAVAQLGTDIGWWRARTWQGRSLAREGGLLALEGRFAEAGAILESSRRLERSPEQCNNLGFVKMKLGDPAGAEVLYREWADSGIDHAKALRSLAGAQEAQRKWLDAGRTLYRLHSLWPRQSTDADLFRTASLLLLGGDSTTALTLIHRFRKLRGNTGRWTAEWENLLGAAERSQGNIDRARVHFLRALERNPFLESARRNLAALGATDPAP